jgi:hypothetical protein
MTVTRYNKDDFAYEWLCSRHRAAGAMHSHAS